MSIARDPYEVLGVPRNASVRQIRAAYVARARRAHPDLVGLRGLDLMRTLNEAWAILNDADRRAEFDVSTGAPPGAPAKGGASSRDDPDRPFWTGAQHPWSRPFTLRAVLSFKNCDRIRSLPWWEI